MSDVIGTRDLFLAHALGSLATLEREQLESLVEADSTLHSELEEDDLSRADLVAHLAIELAETTLRRLTGH